MLDHFIVNVLIAGIGLVVMTSVAGCFVVWRRMAYFGDSLAHSGLLGIWLGLFLGWDLHVSIMLVGLLFGLLITYLKHFRVLSTDTLLGILAHASFAFGLLAIALSGYPNVDLHTYLFGDILTVDLADIYWVLLVGMGVVAAVSFYWSNFVLMTISPALAQAEGINIFYHNLVLIIMMAIVVATAIPLFGVLLVTATLIIPAAAARQLATSPVGMLFLSLLLGVIMLLLGFYLSLIYNLPVSPAIIVTGFCLLMILLCWRRYWG